MTVYVTIGHVCCHREKYNAIVSIGDLFCRDVIESAGWRWFNPTLAQHIFIYVRMLGSRPYDSPLYYAYTGALLLPLPFRLHKGDQWSMLVGAALLVLLS